MLGYGERYTKRVPPALLMKRMVLRAPLLAVIVLLGACSSMKAKENQTNLPVHFVHQDGFDVTWREQHVGDELLLYGVLRNNTSIYLQNLRMTVTLLDEEGNKVDSKEFVDFPIIFQKHASMPFSLKFPFPDCRQGEQVVIDLGYVLANTIGPDYSMFQSICSNDELRKP